MIRIECQPWEAMLAHAQEVYPDECCGAMLGSVEDGLKRVTASLRMENAYPGSRRTRYELRPEELMAAEKEARRQRLELIGIYHSHPDCDPYFSETDLKNSCPWYSFVVLSIRGGRFEHARSWLPNLEQTAAQEEELLYAQDSHSHAPATVR